MTPIMNAPTMTDGQIENAINKLRDAMRKHRSEISSDVAQQVLGTENLGMMMFTSFRERAELVANLIIRKVTVNRNRTPEEALSATGRKQYVNDDVVAGMPKGEGDEAEVVFFKPEPWEYTKPGLMSDEDLEKALDRRGLKPADPYSVCAVNEADKAFADEHPNATHWKDSSGKWCFATFYLWFDGRRMNVRRRGNDWDDRWWFAGVRK